MASKRGTIVRLLVCVLNLFCVVVASVTTVSGAYLFTITEHPTDLLELLPWHTFVTILIVVGVTLVIVSLIGFFATFCESTFLLNAYLYILALCSAVLLALFVGSLVFSGQVANHARDNFGRLMTKFNPYHGNKDETYAVQKLQSSAYCCGNLSPDDWHNQTLVEMWSNGSSDNVIIPEDHFPASCCGQSISLVPISTIRVLCTADNLLYHNGCFSDMQVERYKILLCSIFLVPFMFVLLLLAMSCCLERDLKLQSAKISNQRYATYLNTCATGLLPTCPQDDSLFLHHPLARVQSERRPPRPPAYSACDIPMERYY